MDKSELEQGTRKQRLVLIGPNSDEGARQAEQLIADFNGGHKVMLPSGWRVERHTGRVPAQTYEDVRTQQVPRDESERIYADERERNEERARVERQPPPGGFTTDDEEERRAFGQTR
jgi:hypothetical protein